MKTEIEREQILRPFPEKKISKFYIRVLATFITLKKKEELKHPNTKFLPIFQVVGTKILRNEMHT